MRQIIPLILALTLMIACKPSLGKRLTKEMVDFPQTQSQIDKNLILQYAIDKNVDVTGDASGIYYMIENAGEGPSPTASSRITAHYHGSLLDGTVFDSSRDRGQPFKFNLNQVVEGWQKAIPMLKKGGKGKFIIPSELAYGDRAVGGVIPENSVLVFDIELIDFED